MLANSRVAPANGNGKRTGWPPRAPLSGEKVVPKNSKSSWPSGRCTNAAQADPYFPGKLIASCGKLGFTRTRASSAVLKKRKLKSRIFGGNGGEGLVTAVSTSPVVRSTRPVDGWPGESFTQHCVA